MIGFRLGLLAADRRPLLILGSLDLLLAGGLGVMEIASTSLLLAELGPAALPPLYIGSAAALMLSGALLLPLIDRLDRARFLTALLAVAACSTLLLAWLGPAAPGLAFRALYLLWYLFEQILFLQFWIVAAQVCDIRQAKRLFPPLLGLSLLGGFVAAAGTSALALRVPTSSLLVVSALLLALGLLPARALGRAYRTRLTPHPTRPPRRPAAPPSQRGGAGSRGADGEAAGGSVLAGDAPVALHGLPDGQRREPAFRGRERPRRRGPAHVLLRPVERHRHRRGIDHPAVHSESF